MSEQEQIEVLAILQAFRNFNEAVLASLKGAVKAIKNWDDLSAETRKSMIESIEKLIEQSEKFYEKVPAKH